MNYIILYWVYFSDSINVIQLMSTLHCKGLDASCQPNSLHFCHSIDANSPLQGFGYFMYAKYFAFLSFN